MKPVLTLGACAWTSLFKVAAWPSGSAKIIPQLAMQIGDGMSASAACSIAALSGEVEWWGRVGNDANGHAAIENLQLAGVDCSEVHWVEGVAGSFCTVLIDDEGERLVVPRHDPAMPSTAQWLPLGRLKEFSLVLTEVRWHDGAKAILKAARALGLPGLLDAEVSGPGQLHELCGLASHVLFSETGLQHWLAELPVDERSAFPRNGGVLSLSEAATVEQGLRAVLQVSRAELVGVTLGEHGFYWIERNGTLQHQAALAIKAVDTLAAGDVFHGVYAWAMAQGMDSAQCALQASTAASLKCQTFGGRLGTPTLPQLQHALTQ